jgi:membrane-associated protease RseP (regulator of RpoE activity)
MANRFISLVVFLVILAPAAMGQQIYKWKDEKGRWHFSNAPPAGITVKKVMEGSSVPKAVPARSSNQKTTLSPPAVGRSKLKEFPEAPAGHPSDVPRDKSSGKWLLLIPPPKQGGYDDSLPLSEWRPWQSFESVDACERDKGILIANSIVRRTVFVEGGIIARFFGLRSSKTITEVDLSTVNSRCIQSVEFKPPKEANVLMVFERSGHNPGSITVPVLFGRVFNHGQATARNVVVKFQIRNTRGTTLGKGEIPTVPHDIPGTTSAKFHGKLGGVANLSGLSLHTDIVWSKD